MHFSYRLTYLVGTDATASASCSVACNIVLSVWRCMTSNAMQPGGAAHRPRIRNSLASTQLEECPAQWERRWNLFCGALVKQATYHVGDRDQQLFAEQIQEHFTVTLNMNDGTASGHRGTMPLCMLIGREASIPSGSPCVSPLWHQSPRVHGHCYPTGNGYPILPAAGASWFLSEVSPECID